LASSLGATLGCDRLKPSRDTGASASPSASATTAAATKRVILTGSRSGNYYKAARELNELLGESEKLEIKETHGSFDNISRLGSGEADFAIAQFDALQVFLKLGDARSKMAQRALVVAPLDFEYVHIVVRQKAQIRSIGDLTGKRLGVGPEHSGSWISAWAVMFHINNVNIESAKDVHKLEYQAAIEGLRAGTLDAAFITTAPGMPLLVDLGAEAALDVELLSLGDDFEIPEVVLNTYLVEAIPKKTYPWQPEAVSTLATPSYLLARRELDADTVGGLAKVIYGKSDELKKKSQLWKHVSSERVKQDLAAHVPYHPGVKAHLGL
jgi:TRAP transporter TAXI family solute receptor